jgi:hypothetical protein
MDDDRGGSRRTARVIRPDSDKLECGDEKAAAAARRTIVMRRQRPDAAAERLGQLQGWAFVSFAAASSVAQWPL